MLGSLGLTWIQDKTGLKITTPEAAEAALLTTNYDVRDLVLAAGGDASLLVDTIRATIGPATWRTVRGPGTITPAGGGLQIQQTYHLHRLVERLLADLRQSLRG